MKIASRSAGKGIEHPSARAGPSHPRLFKISEAFVALGRIHSPCLAWFLVFVLIADMRSQLAEK